MDRDRSKTEYDVTLFTRKLSHNFPSRNRNMGISATTHRARESKLPMLTTRVNVETDAAVLPPTDSACRLSIRKASPRGLLAQGSTARTYHFPTQFQS